jgi:hypothetical protein
LIIVAGKFVNDLEQQFISEIFLIFCIAVQKEEKKDYEWHLLINDSIALCLKQLANYLITAFLSRLPPIFTAQQSDPHYERERAFCYVAVIPITCIYI